MAVVRLEIKTRQPLADGREFGDVGRYQQFDGTAHFAVDPAHPLNRAITDILPGRVRARRPGAFRGRYPHPRAG